MRGGEGEGGRREGRRREGEREGEREGRGREKEGERDNTDNIKTSLCPRIMFQVVPLRGTTNESA